MKWLSNLIMFVAHQDSAKSQTFAKLFTRTLRRAGSWRTLLIAWVLFLKVIVKSHETFITFTAYNTI